jgi:hypothetical protein
MSKESNRLVVLALDSTADAYDPWTRRERERLVRDYNHQTARIIDE